MDTSNRPSRFALIRKVLLPALALWLAAGASWAQGDPPGRVADLSFRQGTVVFAPAGDNEWTDLPPNRPLTQGDRLWTDRAARAELQLGMATVQLDDQTQVGLGALDDDEVQFSLTQGTLNARVRQLQPQENFEIATPNLALRVVEPGEYRVDVDPQAFTTRVRVKSGQAMVFDARGNALRLEAGTQMSFTGRDLAQVAQPPGGNEAFDLWAADRNRREDQSLAARYLPRDVVGYSRLDGHGSWSQDPNYGAVWYPRLTLADWAPYRYGHWTHIAPWGWTWVDDAPWGFAPFHYGRWAQIGARWAWVPGEIGPRPRYAPALVVFLGGTETRWHQGGPGVAWYPLAPGDYWRPTYRASPGYVAWFNRQARRDRPQEHRHRGRPEAVTVVRLEDFNRGRPVREHWRGVRADEIARAPVVTSVQALPRPERERDRERDERQGRGLRLQQSPPAVALVPAVPARGQPLAERQQERQAREQQREQRERAEQQQERVQRDQAQRQQQQQQQQQHARQRDQAQERAQREQERQGREQQREQRERAEQHQQQARAQREQAAQRQQQQQQQRAERQQERQERQAQRAAERATAAGREAEPKGQGQGRARQNDEERGRGQRGG